MTPTGRTSGVPGGDRCAFGAIEIVPPVRFRLRSPADRVDKPPHPPGASPIAGTQYAITRGSIPICWADHDAPQVLSKEATTMTRTTEPGYVRLHDLPVFAVDPRSSACSAFNRANAAAAYPANS